MIGLSMGGMIGQDLALRYPDRVASLVLVSTYGAVDGWSGRALRLRRRMIQERGLLAQFDLSLLLVSCPLTVHRAPDLVDAFEAMLGADPPAEHGYLRQLDFCLAHDATEHLPEIVAPTLVVTGSDDILTPPHQGVAPADPIPGASYREVAGASHALVWECPEVFVELVSSFLSWQLAGGEGRRARSLRFDARSVLAAEPLTLS